MVVSRLFSMAAITAVTVSSVAVSPSYAQTYPGINGDIAFTRQRGNESTIIAKDSNGAERVLAAKGADNPIWSPDGRELAFLKNNSLYVVQANGANTRLVASEAYGKVSDPAWSYDGSRLAFVRHKKVGQVSYGAVFVVQKASLQEHNSTGWRQATFSSPSWEPGDKRLVFGQSTPERKQLIIKNLNLGQERLLTTTSEGDYPIKVQWSPNGRKILFTDSAQELYTIWPDGNRRAVISDGESYGGVWSPDGNRIAFFEDSHDTAISISQSNGDITYIPLKSTGSIKRLTWAPNGTALLVEMHDSQATKLIELHLDGRSQELRLVTTGQVTWQS